MHHYFDSVCSWIVSIVDLQDSFLHSPPQHLPTVDYGSILCSRQYRLENQHRSSHSKHIFGCLPDELGMLPSVVTLGFTCAVVDAPTASKKAFYL